MKIGILCRDFNLLRNWELRIINELINNSSYTISLIIKDGRKFAKKGIFARLFNSKNVSGKVLFKFQSFIEENLFPEVDSVDRAKIIGFLNQIDSISLCPKREGFSDVFSEEDFERIKRYDLDLILRHEFSKIDGSILYSAKHGIWSMHHADNSLIRGGPVGFWEIVLNHPYIGVTLQRLTTELDGGLVIEKGYYINDYSFVRSRNLVLEYSVNLLFKNLNLLTTFKSIEYKKSEVYYNQLYRQPNTKWVLKYMLLFYTKLIKNTIVRKIHKVVIKFGLRPKCWAIFSSKGSIFESTLFRTTMLQPNKNEFWADPFIFKHKDTNHLFFENYDYTSKLGKISCGVLENNKISEIHDVLICNYHLSYPFITQNNDGIFMIPEANQNKRLEVYKSTNFPLKWELYATGFEGEHITDPTFYTDSNNDIWLFVNKSILPVTDNNSELYIYKIDSLKLNELIPHKKNPVLIDCRIGRNGGSIFKEGNNIIRPSQYNNFYGDYGYGLNLSIIKKLTLDEYEEELITTIRPNFKKGMIGTHHLCQREDGFVIDGRFNYL